MRFTRRTWLVIAGITVGVIVTMVVVGAALFGFAVRTMRESRTRGGGLEMLTRAEEFRTDHGRWPADEVECYGAELPPFDAWGTPLRLRITGQGDDAELLVWSAGVDRSWDSKDDWVVASEPRDAATRRGLRTAPR